MTTVLEGLQGRRLHSSPCATEIHVPAALAAYERARVSPSSLRFARSLLRAGIVIAVFCCLFKAPPPMALESRGSAEAELLDGPAQEKDRVVDGLPLLSLNDETAREDTPAIDKSAPVDDSAPIDEAARESQDVEAAELEDDPAQEGWDLAELELMDETAQEQAPVSAGPAQDDSDAMVSPATGTPPAPARAIPETCLQVSFKRGSLLSHKVRAFFRDCTDKTVIWKLGSPGQYVDYEVRRAADVRLPDGEQDMVNFLRDRFGIQAVYDNQNQVYFYDD